MCIRRNMDKLCVLGIDVEATGRRIDMLFRRHGITTKQMSDILHVTYQCVDKWRKGRCLPESQNLYILAKIFNKNVDDILVGLYKKDINADEHSYDDLTSIINKVKLHDVLRRIVSCINRTFFVNMHIVNEKICYDNACILYEIDGIYIDYENYFTPMSVRREYAYYFRECIERYSNLISN